MTPRERRQGFTSLMADVDEQWRTVGDCTFRTDGDVLYCEPQGSGFLHTAREFDDFTLELEFAASEDCNSGVFIRTSREGRPAFEGMEFQILDDHGADPGVKSTGAIYAALEPAANPMRPAGEWNTFRVRADGPHVEAHLNGVRIHDVNLDEHTEEIPNEEPPTPLAERQRSGYIGLQSHGEPRPAYFRNVRVREHV